ncbi:MAG: hypothetical protein IJT95_01610, partial [Abditibacteriota bacterium]|nr:hypothetical protein [Abditibacteriota bacterium]
PMRQGTVYDILASMCDAFGLNVELANGHLDFSDIKWFEKIKAVVSAETIAKWAKEYEDTGYLSLETLLEMGSFSPSQLSFALNTGDTPLKGLAGILIPNSNVLEMLSLCDGTALSSMMDGGVRSGYLNKRAFNAYRNLYQTAGFSGRTGCRIALSSDVSGGALTYKVEFTPDDGSSAKTVEFRIPVLKK